MGSKKGFAVWIMIRKGRTPRTPAYIDGETFRASERCAAKGLGAPHNGRLVYT